MKEKEVGKITHFYDHIGVGVVKVTDKLSVGDKIHIKGHTTDFEQEVVSMQLEHASLKEAKKGHDVGLKVDQEVREHDIVYKVV